MSAINRDKAIEVIEDELDKIDHVPQWVFDRLTNRLRELPHTEPYWIPVRERLPDKENKSYWVCTNTGYQCQCRWTNNVYGLGAIGDRWGWKIIDIPQYTYVIAWMPLPEPYAERKQND
jgi:hypothetical protein